MSFTVLHPGMATRLVDAGRPGSRSLGVPVGGAADRWSLALGNGLVGNAPETLGLEISLKGPTLRADGDVGAVVFGAPFVVHSNHRYLEVGQTFVLRAGEELMIGGTPAGVRAYLCVRGGFEAPSVLGSRSGLEPIRAGEVLACRVSATPIRRLAEGMVPQAEIIDVLPGLQASWFEWAEFLDQAWTVTPASNRMGLRLQGQALTMPAREMASEPVCPGSIQATRDGQCIVLGVDGQTIGGYPKIAQVIQADVDRLGQLRPGAKVRFRMTTQAEAEAKFHQRLRQLREWDARLRLTYRS